MKKLILLGCTMALITLTGCFENTIEITLNADGSGTVSSLTDMSKTIAMAKQMGGADELEKAGDTKIDTSFVLGAGADSIPGLSAEERTIVSQATASFHISLKDEKFKTGVLFSFAKPDEISTRISLSSKIQTETLKDQMGGGGEVEGLGDIGSPSSIDDYFVISSSRGKITRQLNKEKYAKLSEDTYLESLKSAAAMGLNNTSTFIIHLPKAAKKAEGSGVQLSEDKKTVTVKAELDDLYNLPAKFEFVIEY